MHKKWNIETFVSNRIDKLQFICLTRMNINEKINEIINDN